MSPTTLPTVPSPDHLAHWLRQQLAASWVQQQVAIGEMVWPQSQLVLLLEYALLSAQEVRTGLTLWCESLPLLGLPWYPTLTWQAPHLRLQFDTRQAQADPQPLWYLLQLLHLRLRHWHPKQPWRLEWPQRQGSTPAMAGLLASRFAPQPALELDLTDWPASPYPEWQDLHAPGHHTAPSASAGRPTQGATGRNQALAGARPAGPTTVTTGRPTTGTAGALLAAPVAAARHPLQPTAG